MTPETEHRGPSSPADRALADAPIAILFALCALSVLSRALLLLG